MRIKYYLNKYDLFELTSLLFDVIISKIRVPSARIIRRPMSIRGKKLIQIGDNFTSGFGLRLDAFLGDHNDYSSKVLFIGNNVQINDYVHIAAGKRVVIGDNVLIASKVFITDHNHGSYSDYYDQDSPNSIPISRKLYFSDVVIEDNVWIGEFVSILPGVVLGKGSIIGSMSVVTKSIPPFTIAVGSPARVIKKYNFVTNHWDKV